MTYRLLRDPVGIRTPNLRIRSAMLYPVELQSRCLHDLAVNRGAKIDRLLSRPNTPLKKGAKKRNPHRLGPSRCRLVSVLPMRILQAFP